jgi:acyloxyacyl hydrolase
LSEVPELIENLDLSIDPFSWLTNIVHKFSSQHLPILDLDGDKFGGDEAGFRGYHWRGRDCDDTNANIYPGRKNYDGSDGDDYNCNGISGKSDSGESYKDLYCKNSG